MAAHSAIEWTDATVNFWWGCTEVGPGCQHCYARALDARFSGGGHWGVGAPRRKIKGAAALLHRLDNGYSEWAADAICRRANAKAFGLPVPNVGDRRRVFIQSLSDLFDLEVPLEWFAEGWRLIEACDRLAIQIVTKRVSAVEKRLTAIGRTTWPQHAGLIITVVNQDEADRDIPRLLALKARLGIPWVGLSIEPMLGAIVLRPEWLAEIDWVIVGGESGSHARPMHPDWARNLRDQCAAAGVPFFFKQWGEWTPSERGREECSRLVFQNGDALRIASDHEDIMVAFAEDYRGAPTHIWRDYWASGDGLLLRRVGKRAAGRLLDGREHNDMAKAIA